VARLQVAAATNQGCRTLVPLADIDVRFYLYVLLSRRGVLQAMGQGSTFLELSAGDLERMEVPVPARRSQIKIADYLDRETARIDALIEKNRQLSHALSERFTAHMSNWTRAALALNSKAALPTEWRRLRIRRLLALSRYGIGEAARQSGITAVLSMSHVRDGEVVGQPVGYVDFVDPELRLCVGDLLFNRTNSLALVGKVGLVRSLQEPTTVASYLVILRTNELAHPTYLNYLLNTPEVLGLARSMALPSIGQANLNPARYGAIAVAVPSADEQAIVAQRLDAARDLLEQSLRAIARTIALLREKRQALITAAVTGQIDTPSAA
jgi:type I restriction enzyme S subunit